MALLGAVQPNVSKTKGSQCHETVRLYRRDRPAARTRGHGYGDGDRLPLPGQSGDRRPLFWRPDRRRAEERRRRHAEAGQWQPEHRPGDRDLRRRRDQQLAGQRQHGDGERRPVELGRPVAVVGAEAVARPERRRLLRRSEPDRASRRPTSAIRRSRSSTTRPSAEQIQVAKRQAANIAPAVAIFGDAESTNYQGNGNEADATVTQSNEATQSQSSEAEAVARPGRRQQMLRRSEPDRRAEGRLR